MLPVAPEALWALGVVVDGIGALGKLMHRHDHQTVAPRSGHVLHDERRQHPTAWASCLDTTAIAAPVSGNSLLQRSALHVTHEIIMREHMAKVTGRRDG